MATYHRVACELHVDGEEKAQEAFWCRATNVPLPDQPRAAEDGGVRIADFSFLGHAPMPPKGSVQRAPTSGTDILMAILAGPDDPHYLRNKVWGTKSDAMDVELDQADGRVRFQTAGSAPGTWLAKARAAHPDLKFTMFYADENWGSNCGVIVPNGSTRAVADDLLRKMFPQYCPPDSRWDSSHCAAEVPRTTVWSKAGRRDSGEARADLSRDGGGDGGGATSEGDSDGGTPRAKRARRE